MRSKSYLKSRFEQNLLISFLIILLGIITLAIKTYKNNLIHEDITQRLEHTREALFYTEEVSKSVKEIESGVRAYVITGDSAYLAPYLTNQLSIFAQINSLKVLTKDNPVQQQRVERLKSFVTDKLSAAQYGIELKNTKGFEKAQAFISTKGGIKRTNRIDSLVSDIQAEEDDLLKLRKQAGAISSHSFKLFYFTLIAALIIVLSLTFIALWRNLKARHKAEVSLIESKDLLQSIIDNTTSIIYIKDLNGRFTLVNKQYEKFLHLKPGEAIGKTLLDVLPQSNTVQLTQNDQIVIREGKLIEVEEEIVNDGEHHHFYSIKFPLRNRRGTVYAIGGISTNITEVITKQQLEKQKEITETTIEAQEKERNHLGRELHDNVNQLLVYAKLMLDVAKSNADIWETCIKKCQEAILNATAEVRNLSHALTAPSFEGESFTDSIDDLAQGVHLTGRIKTQLNFCSKDELNSLPSKVKVTLYRIIQEQVNNIIKYAKASMIAIDLKLYNKNIFLSIADDGVGFDTRSKSRGIGLRNIQSRVEFYSGTMKITSAPNKGCSLQVEIPMQDSAAE